jgi:rod shape determining protein RodA
MIIGETAGVPPIGPAETRRQAALREGGVLRRFDWPLFGSALALAALGAVMVWSATRARTELTGGDPQYFLKRHVLNAIVGVALAIGVTALDFKRLRALTPLIYVLSFFGLLAVLSPLGTVVNGARSWIELGAGFSIQPAEFAKLGIVMALAMILAHRPPVRRSRGLLAQIEDRRIDETRPAGRQLVLALLAAAVPMGVISLLPDLGSTMVIVAITVGMIMISGVRLRRLAVMGVLGAVGVFAVVKLHLLAQHQLNRFAAFADPNLDPQGVGYNTHQARLAIGSGGMFGQGLFRGTQTNGQFVPEQQTDFVFTVIGEELGLFGGMLVIGLFAVLLWRGCVIARQATDAFSLLLSGGVVCWFAFQMFENVGMTLGIMPVAGIPLPFVSYGGSSMFANFIAIGILENVRLRSTAR